MKSIAHVISLGELKALVAEMESRGCENKNTVVLNGSRRTYTKAARDLFLWDTTIHIPSKPELSDFRVSMK